MKTKIVLLSAILASCAASPESVRPAFVSADPYIGMSCDQLAGERQRLALAVSDTSLKQERARSADTVGVLLLFLPLGSMSGQNREGELATLKGQAVAVDQVKFAKSCAVG